jgi:hypothetical protein
MVEMCQLYDAASSNLKAVRYMGKITFGWNSKYNEARVQD